MWYHTILLYVVDHKSCLHLGEQSLIPDCTWTPKHLVKQFPFERKKKTHKIISISKLK